MYCVVCSPTLRPLVPWAGDDSLILRQCRSLIPDVQVWLSTGIGLARHVCVLFLHVQQRLRACD